MAAASAPKPLLWQLGFLAVMGLLFICILKGKYDSPYGVPLDDDYSTEHTCSLSSSIAEDLKLTDPVSYGRLRIDVEESAWYHRLGNDSEIKDLGISLPSLRRLSKEDGFFVAAEDETCVNQTTIKIRKPSPSDVDASNIVFGVATNLDRLEESLLAFSHWAGGTGTKILSLVAINNDADADADADTDADIDQETADRIDKILRDAEDLGIDLEIARQNLSSESTDGDRYFALTKQLYEHRPENSPPWAAFIDDDTFFPSMYALLQRLDQYDVSQPQYIGGLTEDLHQMQFFGYMAYGGGGVFLSWPLLAQVYENFEECNGTAIEGGDKRLADCIYAHTTTKLSWESDLHQTDLHGDASGFYEAGRAQPLSVHHWKSWNEVDVVGLSAVASVCGVECLLQRYQFEDGWFLVNGFSIFKYSSDYETDDIVMEETWWDGGDYMHSLAPLKPKDEGKVSYRLESSVADAGRVRQFYVRRNDDGDGVIEVVWRRSP